MSPARRLPWIPLAVGAALAIVAAVVAVSLFTRTEWGRERVLAYTLKTLGGRLNGTLLVERLEGDLFTGARLYDVSLVDRQGRPVLRSDSAYIDYRLPTFFGGDVVIRRLDLYSPDLFLRRLPGDSLWNYQQVLLDTTRVRRGPGRATLIDRLNIVDGDVEVVLPWEPDRRLTPAQQRREVREALSDTSRLAVKRVPGGLLRTMTFRVDTGSIAQLSIAPDERGGTYLRVSGAEGLANLYRDEPLRIRSLQGELALRSGLLRYRAPTLVLPRSRVTTSGTIDMRGEEPRYDLRVLGSNVALSDMQWLYPPFPERGRADFRMWLETRPQGTLYRFRDVRFSAPGTRMVGHFGLLVGDTVIFSDVDLVARPLDVPTVRQMLPWEIPIRGLRIGSLEIQSPAR